MPTVTRRGRLGLYVVLEPEWIDRVDRARAGDAAARDELLRQFEPLVRATASRLIDPDRADDVVQESFAVALERLPSLRTSAAFPSWMRLIVRKQASLRRRRQAASSLDAVDPPATSGSEPDAVVQERAVADVVRHALGELRTDDRRLLELRYLAGWSNADLANLLAVSNGALRKRLHDARRRLRPHLEHLNQEITMTDYTTYLDQIHDASLQVPAAPPLRRPDTGRATTGLKVIDTMAPVRRGGTIEMVGPAGTGQLVVALELLYRLGRTPKDIACVAVGATGAAIGSQRDLGHVTTEPGIPGRNAAILTKDPSEGPQALTAGATLAAGLAQAGLDVVLVVDEPTIRSVDPKTLANAAGIAEEGAVTVIAVRTVDPGTQLPPQLGFDTTLVFSIEQFALRIFPAIDPTECVSRFAISDTAERAKRHLRRAATARSWFNQPLFVAEDFTGTAGEWIEPIDAEQELVQQLHSPDCPTNVSQDVR